MSVQAIQAGPWPAPPGVPAVREVVGVLADGTPFYAPVGAVCTDGATVTCHLCGRRLRSVSAHLRLHGWTKAAYCEAFGLERGQSLEGQDTRKRRAAAFAPRLIFDPAIRAGSAAGRRRAAAGEVTREAAGAVAGRPLPEQRRRKAMQALDRVSPEAVAQANRGRAAAHLQAVAARVAAAQGYPDLGTLVLAQAGAGASLAAISRKAGLHKDWLARHLAQVDPQTAAQLAAAADRPGTARWQAAVAAAGFRRPADYLRDRHLQRHWSVNAISAEVGMSHHAVESALRRHGLARTAHAGSRHQAQRRAAAVAARLGAASMSGHIAQRRAAGWTWAALAAEAGEPATWLRRQAATAAASMPAHVGSSSHGSRPGRSPGRRSNRFSRRWPTWAGQAGGTRGH